MKQKRLEQIFIEHDAFVSGMEFSGKCHDCDKAISVKVNADESGFHTHGGVIYEPEHVRIFLKCDDCFKRKPWLSKWFKCKAYVHMERG